MPDERERLPDELGDRLGDEVLHHVHVVRDAADEDADEVRMKSSMDSVWMCS